MEISRGTTDGQSAKRIKIVDVGVCIRNKEIRYRILECKQAVHTHRNATDARHHGIPQILY